MTMHCGRAVWAVWAVRAPGRRAALAGRRVVSNHGRAARRVGGGKRGVRAGGLGGVGCGRRVAAAAAQGPHAARGPSSAPLGPVWRCV